MEKLPAAPLRQALNLSASLAQLGATLGSEVVDVVEGMHGTIARAPFVFSKKTHPTRGITRFVYSCVRQGFSSSAWLGHKLSSLSQPALEQELNRLTPTIGVLNGVFGDHLHSTGNGLATTMELPRPGMGKGNETIIVFLHGLCMTELGWITPAQQHFCEQQSVNSDIAYLRYNSGRHIHENGALFSEKLTQLANDYPRIILVGHSMGGLVINSALQHAQAGNANWPDHISHIVTLGTPFAGAPLERAGEFANGLLNITAYTMPLWRLGNLRSAGIKDLRYGKISSGEYILAHQPMQRWSNGDNKAALLIAATRSAEINDDIHKNRHDMLVPVPSALAHEDDGRDTMQRQLYAAINHMELMGDERVYERIRRFIQS